MLVLDRVHAYYGSAHVLQGISLEVHPGQIACLIGRNGAGKSTTLKTIMGVVKPSAGRITFKGKLINDQPPHKIAGRGLAWVPEDRRIFPSLSVEDNIRVAAQAMPGASQPRAAAALGVFPDLQARAKQRGGSLSGGQQQMLSIARALASGPDLVMLDEPSEGLSPMMVQTIRAGIFESRARGVSILLVEQNLALALALAEVFFVLSRGVVVHQASRDQILSDPNLVRKHLGVSAIRTTSTDL
jgi:branched-chain amino acid transport system ATP-binding protein